VMVRPGEPIPVADFVILPGSKATIADLAFFRAQGWDIDLFAHVRRGGRVLGVCGGYQMLGRRIADPDGIEGPPGAVDGLGLLDVETIMGGDKALRSVAGTCLANGAPFAGYEMHIGRTTGPDCARPLLRYGDSREDGAMARDGRVMGAYAHGLFADDAQRAAWLAPLGALSEIGYEATVEATLDELAAHLAKHVDLDALLSLAR
jgi:adenosylcobyric acid synthase